jgi:AcrR family transcriptional regulator
MTMRESTRTRILDAAEELFFTGGIAATPIDAVIDHADVSAATLYRGFGSKDGLVAAALARRHEVWLETWDARVRAATDERSRLLAVFDALDDFSATPMGSRWCAVLGTAAEYTDPPEPVRIAVETDADAYLTRLRALAEPLVGADRAPELAADLLLLVSGALAMRLRTGDRFGATAKRAAARLIL